MLSLSCAIGGINVMFIDLVPMMQLSVFREGGVQKQALDTICFATLTQLIQKDHSFIHKRKR